MSNLHPTKDNRTTYDEKTGAVRSFFGAELVGPLPKAKRVPTPTAKSDHFLKINHALFRLENISLKAADVREGGASQSVRYQQYHHDIPVYGAQLVVGLRKHDGAITSAVNKIDYGLPDTLGPSHIRLSADEIVARMHQRFAERFKGIEITPQQHYVYRHAPPVSIQLPYDSPPIRDEMLNLGSGSGGQVYLVWQMIMDTKNPNGNWELLVDATNGEIVAVKDRRRYATRKGKVFWPDPIRSSQNDNLNWSTQESVLNNEQVEVDLENLDGPVSGKYKLNGEWIKLSEKESPDYTPPETAGDFKYNAKNRSFLDVMAYYYLDRLITYLRSLGVTSYNTVVDAKDPLDIDPQGLNGSE